MKTCTCGIDIMDHPASRCLDALVADKLFGIVKKSWDFEFTLKHYSSYISDAWEVVDMFEDISISKNTSPAGKWEVIGNIKGEPVCIYSDELPLAICRAALLTEEE